MFQDIALRFVKILEGGRLLFVVNADTNPVLFDEALHFAEVCQYKNIKCNFFHSNPYTIWISGFLPRADAYKATELIPGKMYRLSILLLEVEKNGQKYINTVFKDVTLIEKAKVITNMTDLFTEIPLE